MVVNVISQEKELGWWVQNYMKWFFFPVLGGQVLPFRGGILCSAIY